MVILLLIITYTGIVMETSLVTPSENSRTNFRFHPKDGAYLATKIESKQGAKLYLYLVANCNKGNYITGTLKELESKTGIQTSHLSNAFSELRKLGIVRKVRSGLWIINPKVVNQGNSKNLFLVELEWNKAK